MIKNNIKKLMVTLITVLLVVSVAYTTYATEGDDWLAEMLKGNNTAVQNLENLEQIPEGTVNNASTNANANENKPATTPHAGIEDYSGLVFVVVFGTSAIYAYKKVKEYNV